MSTPDPYAGLGTPDMAPPAVASSISVDHSAAGWQPQSGLTPTNAKKAWDSASAVLEKQIANLPDAAKTLARDKFFNDPRIQKIREAAAAPVTPTFSTRQQDVQKVARARLDARPGGALRNGVTDALEAGAGNFLGIVPRVSAAMHTVADKVAGDDTSYSHELDISREENRQMAEGHPVANIIGSILGGVGPAKAFASGVTRAGAAMAGSVDPLVAVTGKGLQAATQLQEGQHVTNVARLALGGSAAGAAQAAGEGSDIERGAITGAIAAPALVGGGKAVGWAGKKALDILGLRNADQILRSITTATKDQIAAKVSELQAQGIEPTLFEVLPMADRNRISKSIVGRSDPTLEGTQRLVAERVGNMGPEMASRVDAVTAPGRQDITQGLTDAMTDARGTPGAPAQEMPGDAAVAARATRSPIDMEGHRQAEDRAIMAPHDDRVLFDQLNHVIPHNPELQENGDIHIVEGDPAVSAMIRRKAGILRFKDIERGGGGLTGRDMSDLLSNLRSTVHQGGAEGDVAQAAINHIEDVLAQDHPEFLDANSRMNAANASRARMAEGMAEGTKTRTRDTVPVGSPAALRQARNAYDTTEGADGRFLGQANELGTRFSQATPRQAIASAAGLPADQAAITANLGAEPAAAIAQTAQAQTEGAQALAGLDTKRGTNAASFGPEDLAATVLGLNPASMIRTKVMALHKLSQLVGIPEKKATALVEMLFSTNPVKRGQVLNMLNSVPGGKDFLAQMVAGFAGSAGAAQATAPAAPQPSADAPPVAAPAQAADPYAGLGSEEQGEPEGAPDPEASEAPPAPAATPDPAVAAMQAQLMNGADPQMQELLRQIQGAGAAPGQENDGVPHGRRVIKSIFPEAHVTDDVRPAQSALGKKNPTSWHVNSDKAVDVRPIPGLTFAAFVDRIKSHGYDVIEAIDEVKHPSRHATGPHWHVVIA